MRYKTLNSLWKEILFAMSGVGPGFLMILMSAYLTGAINPAALPDGSPLAITGMVLILPTVFPILIMAAKMLDGVVDVPLANMLDNLKPRRIGKTKLPIVIGFFPMVISYCMCWTMVSDNRTLMTAWIVVWSVIFFVCYSNNLLAFYGSIASVCVDSHQRMRVSAFKAFFETLSYCACYALVPVLVSDSFRIDRLALVCTPLMLTLIIPLFLVKEGPRFEKKCVEEGYEIPATKNEQPVGLFKSFAIVCKNKSFMRWMAVNCCSFFGLQMFLASMSELITSGMGLPPVGMTILNTCAFAPVPLMLYFFQKIKNGKGVRFAYRVALITFAACIMGFFFGSQFFLGTNNVTLQYIIGCIGGVSGSFAIGAFLLMPTMLPAQIGAHDQKLSGKNNSAMFFAIQAVLTTVAGAVSGGLVYEYVKMLFIDKSSGKIVWAEGAADAAAKMGVDAAGVFNFGLLLVPFIVSAVCILGFVLCRFMPRNYSLREIAVLSKKTDVLDANPKLEIEDETRTKKVDDFGINIALFVLTGGLFGLVWRFALLKKLAFDWWWLPLSIICPPLFIYLTFKMASRLNLSGGLKGALTALSCLFGLNIVIYIVLDRKLYRRDNPTPAECESCNTCS